MGQKPAQVDVDPKVLEDSNKLWVSFMQLTKYSIIAVIVILALMAVTLL